MSRLDCTAFRDQTKLSIKPSAMRPEAIGTAVILGTLWSNSAAQLTSAPYMFSDRCADELKAIREISLPEER